MCDENGTIFEVPGIEMTGMEWETPCRLEQNETISLPFGSDLFMIPDSIPVGYDPGSEEYVEIEYYGDRRVYAVAAFLAPAHLQYYLPAFKKKPTARPLPLYSYTAAGWDGTGVVASAVRIDNSIRQDLRLVKLDEIETRAPETIRRYEGNRLVRHLVENCALCYGCPAARNFVMNRWECPVPTAPECNARCAGCISLQPDGSGIPAAQPRIAFVPTAEEIVEYTVPHLEEADEAVISFGQGCEGEPLLYADLIADAIKKIRRLTGRGIINLNTNGSLPEKVKLLCDAGLDSIRLSLNSVQADLYDAYYRPKNYGLHTVLRSLETAESYDLWTSLNYFIFPGLTDHPAEAAALFNLLENSSLDMIQTRNLNIDPFFYTETLNPHVQPAAKNAGDENRSMGIRGWLGEIKRRFPGLRLGYFNPSRESMKKDNHG